MANRPERHRLERLCDSIQAREWGEQAAIHNEPWVSNPYPMGTYFWSLWAEAFQRTIEKLAAQEDGR